VDKYFCTSTKTFT